MLDILIRNGWVADGTGNPTYPADIAVQGDRIVAVGTLKEAEAARVIDATGKIVSPGFIDVHSHTDSSILANPTAQSTIRQGITTELVGQCGSSSAPLAPDSRDAIVSRLEMNGYDGPVPWASFSEYLDFMSRFGTSCNLGFFIGHNTMRRAVDLLDAEPTEDQLKAMEDHIRDAMDAGALGWSTGLEFEPGRRARTPELVRLARVLGEYVGACYASHIRNRDARLQESVDEFLAIARAAGQKAEISHLNVRHNTGAAEGAWDQAVESIGRARQNGLDVLADTTPLLDGIGQAQGILPPWVLDRGTAKAAELLKDPVVRKRLRGECDRYWRFIHRGEWHRVRLQTSAEFPELCGKTMVEIAEILGKDEWESYFDILSAAGSGMGSIIFIGQLFTEEHSADMVRHPLFNLAVDSFTTTADGPLAQRSRHPLGYIGMIHYLTHHVREKRTLRLEEAIRKMTSMPATHFGLKDRGQLRRGACADIVVFDFENLDEVSTIEHPNAYVRGVEYVIVNGTAVVDQGEHTGALPGRPLRRA